MQSYFFTFESYNTVLSPYLWLFEWNLHCSKRNSFHSHTSIVLYFVLRSAGLPCRLSGTLWLDCLDRNLVWSTVRFRFDNRGFLKHCIVHIVNSCLLSLCTYISGYTYDIHTCPWVIHHNKIPATAFIAISIERLREDVEKCKLRHDSTTSPQGSTPSAARNGWVNSDHKRTGHACKFLHFLTTCTMHAYSWFLSYGTEKRINL